MMRVRRDESDVYLPSENECWGDEEEEVLCHKRKIKKRLEEKLEHRRLRHELDDYAEDYDWDEDHV
jgi:hypothetical protein